MTRRYRGYEERTVARWMQGEPVELTVDERREVVHRLTMRGLSFDAIAERIGMSEGTVRNDLKAWTPRPTPQVDAADAGLPTMSHDEMVDIVCQLAIDVRDEDPRRVLDEIRHYSDANTIALLFTAVAMVPVDVPATRLLAWTFPLVDKVPA